MKLIQAVFVAAVLLQLTGCAIGQRIDYRQAVPALNLSTDAEVAVSVVDQRPYVTAQRKNPNYVGTLLLQSLERDYAERQSARDGYTDRDRHWAGAQWCNCHTPSFRLPKS